MDLARRTGRRTHRRAARGVRGSDGSIDLFVLGIDGHAYRRTFANGAWGAWTSLGGNLADAPTVAYTGPDAWTLTATGTDGQSGP